MKSKINFRIRNTLSASVVMNLFNKSSISSAANQRTQYIWDITAETFTGTTSVTIQARTSGVVFTDYVKQLQVASAAGLIEALNSLNIGFFFLTTSGGSTFVNVLNDVIVYGNLNLNTPATTNVTWNFIFNVAVATPYSFTVTNTTTATLLFQANDTQSGSTSISTALWSPGDIITFNLNVSVLHGGNAQLFRNAALVSNLGFPSTLNFNGSAALVAISDTWDFIVTVNS